MGNMWVVGRRRPHRPVVVPMDHEQASQRASSCQSMSSSLLHTPSLHASILPTPLARAFVSLSLHTPIHPPVSSWPAVGP